jgi:hypothetical protein
MDSAKEQLCAVALDLFLAHKVSHEEMFRWIRDTITHAVVNQPKDRVLYNASHGCYGVSKQFQEFVGNADLEEESKEFRAKASQLVGPFGKSVLDQPKNAGLRESLLAYKCSVLHKVRRDAETIYRNMCRLANLEINVPELAEYLSDPYRNMSVEAHPAFPWARVEYLGSERPNTWFCSYTRENLEEILKKARDGSFPAALHNEIRYAEDTALKHVSRDTLDDFVTHLADIKKVKR